MVLNHLSVTDSSDPKFAIVRDTLDPGSIQGPSRSCSELRVLRLSARSASPERLDERKLAISKPYRLIAEDQAQQWIRNRVSPSIPTDPPAPEPMDPYPGSTDLIRLSRIIYNSHRTWAAVYVSNACGSLCGLFGWWIVQKSEGSGGSFQTQDARPLSDGEC